MALRFVAQEEIGRLLAAGGDAEARAALFADACRVNVLSMIMEAGSGHVGTSFSCLDILSWLHLEVMGPDDRYFSSKGHDAPALYAVLAGLGRLEFGQIHRLRRLGGLPGHPDIATVPQVHTNTGSLGMGISKARGFVLADRLQGRAGTVYVLTGDGELQEGQFWESLQPTANRGLTDIVVIVDHNKIQSDTWVHRVSDLGRLEDRVEAAGWAVARCDGNDLSSFGATLRDLRKSADGRPELLVADTRKGAGVSFMEGPHLADSEHALYDFHSGAPSPGDYQNALDELVARIDERLAAAGVAALRLVAVEPAPRPAPAAGAQALVPAYGRALVKAAERRADLVVLDADLRLDCGLVEFAQTYPDRFFECGIAEQDMVSQAGAMALAGLLPVVHSFACFLSTRPNEQIYNNASEGSKVIYVGSLAGLVPGGPGHSHQSVRDISALGAVPGLAMLEPASPFEVGAAVRWAIDEAAGPVYVRLVSVPWALGFELPHTELVQGRGTVVQNGDDATIVASGPVMLSQAFQAAERLEQSGLSATLLALPWLRDVDGEWLAGAAAPSGPIFCLDNHYAVGGQGDAVLHALQGRPDGAAGRIVKLGVDRLPVCGTNDEVLRAHGLDDESLASRMAAHLGAYVSSPR